MVDRPGAAPGFPLCESGAHLLDDQPTTIADFRLG
jgi:hypothetical protein